MPVKYRYVPQHKDGTHFLDPHSQPVQDFMKAIRFANPEDDYAVWLLGRYGPADPQNYQPALVKITYELEVGSDVQEK
ncbi:hypothetical protein D3C73_470730 [compost metagenome]